MLELVSIFLIFIFLRFQVTSSSLSDQIISPDVSQNYITTLYSKEVDDVNMINFGVNNSFTGH